jgi:hypothetical protein
MLQRERAIQKFPGVQNRQSSYETGVQKSLHMARAKPGLERSETGIAAISNLLGFDQASPTAVKLLSIFSSNRIDIPVGTTSCSHAKVQDLAAADEPRRALTLSHASVTSRL